MAQLTDISTTEFIYTAPVAQIRSLTSYYLPTTHTTETEKKNTSTSQKALLLIQLGKSSYG